MANRPAETRLWYVGDDGKIDWQEYIGKHTLKFTGPQDLWEAACKYFDWVEENPIETEVHTAHQGVIIVDDGPVKARPFTMNGMALFLRIDKSAFYFWMNNDDHILHPAAKAIWEVIYTQKFEGAAAGLFNANLISRDLGLADARDHRSSDGSMNGSGMIAGSIPVRQLSSETLEAVRSDLTKTDKEHKPLFGPIEEDDA